MHRGRPLLLLGLLAAALLSLGVLLRPEPATLRTGVHTLQGDPTELGLAHQAGFDTMVHLLAWWEIEPTRGQFIWQAADEAVAGAAHYGLDLIIRLDKHPTWSYPDPLEPGAPPVRLDEYARFVQTVAQRYKGQVLGYIIWNEPNLALEWSDLPPHPEAYTALLEAGYRAVKEVDPDALVISAGLAPTNTQNDDALDDRLFLERMYRAGAAAYFDILGAHSYGFGLPPDAPDVNPDEPAPALEGLNFTRLADLRAIMEEHGDGHKPVWVTEMGWTVEPNAHSAWHKVDEREQADFLVQAFELAGDEWPWVELLTVWNLGGEQHPEWRGYSILRPDGSPRPAYIALQNMEKRPPGEDAGVIEGLRNIRSAPPAQHQVLAEDAVIHLGDADMGTPWVPLHLARNPSPRWDGVVYLVDPGDEDWQLSVRVMQSNYWGNRLWVNGVPLPDPAPVEDFSKSWVTVTWQVPAALLRKGPNAVGFSVTHAAPLIQDRRFAYDEVQIKDMVLWR